MLISFSYIYDKYDLKDKIKGILHVGAHECEELKIYIDHDIDIKKQLWIEALTDLVEKCKKKYEDVNIINAIISDEDNKEIEFNITNNFSSSSILNLKTHLQEHPHIHVIDKIKGFTKTLKTVYDENNIPYDKFNFMNLDIQGAELLALKGLQDILNNFDYIYTEVNVNELYENCCLINQIDDFLSLKGFQRVETNITGHGWGDAFYIRKTLSL